MSFDTLLSTSNYLYFVLFFTRKKKCIHLKGGGVKYYDELVLTCGLQFQHPDYMKESLELETELAQVFVLKFFLFEFTGPLRISLHLSSFLSMYKQKYVCMYHLPCRFPIIYSFHTIHTSLLWTSSS